MPRLMFEPISCNAVVVQGPFLQEWKSLESVETVTFPKGVSGDHVDDKAQRLRAANVFQVPPPLSHPAPPPHVPPPPPAGGPPPQRARL